LLFSSITTLPHKLLSAWVAALLKKGGEEGYKDDYVRLSDGGKV
jgi:hypothetical protein